MKILAITAVLLFSIAAQADDAAPAASGGFALTSKDMQADQPMSMDQVFNSFGCTGKNVSPELSWTAGPEGTKSYALTMYDPDAPTGSGWWHWTVFNIPAKVLKLEKGAGNKHKYGEGRTDFGKPGYGGPCPPPGSGNHHYVFTVYALKVDKLPLDANASGAMVGYNLNANALAKASLTAVFGR
jgi:Raf kinase inhibitor-like YbhB/YbcL family protein